MKPAPIVGQLQTGEWAVFNTQGTGLWEKTFPDEVSAQQALRRYLMTQSYVAKGSDNAPHS